MEDENRPVDYFSYVLGGVGIGVYAAIATAIITYFLLALIEIPLMIFKGAFYTWLGEENGEMKILITFCMLAFFIPLMIMMYIGYTTVQKDKKLNEQAKMINVMNRKENSKIEEIVVAKIK